MKEDLLKIINHYGVLNQLKYIQTEYFELEEAIFDYEYSGWDFDDEDAKDLEAKYKNHIIEELADVYVMLKQFQYYYGIENKDIEMTMRQKIERQLDRIEEEKTQKNQK